VTPVAAALGVGVCAGSCHTGLVALHRGRGTQEFALAEGGPPERSARESPLVAAFLEKRDNLTLFMAARLRSLEAAEDLAQELFLKVAQLPPDTDVRSPVPLLYRMAANLVVDHVRSAGRAGRRDGQWRQAAHVQVGDIDVAAERPADQALMEKQQAQAFARAVAELPPQMGRAFRLHKLEGRSQTETAELMGVSRKMVEAHIAAAVKRLTERFRPQ
jgi:RNA polymerase sigma-70 factor (ECF subfamily)